MSYYTIGTGPSLLIKHGAVSYALTHRDIAIELSPYYTVHIISRRGRGLSSCYPASVTGTTPLYEKGKTAKAEDTITIGGKDIPRVYHPKYISAIIDTEIADLNALLTATQAQYLIAVSSGALIALRSLLASPTSPVASLKRIIIFEPPIVFSDHPSGFDVALLERFEREYIAGDELGYMVTAMHLVQLGPGWIPRWIMKILSGMMFSSQDKAVEKRKAAGEEDEGVCTMRGLGRLLRYDLIIAMGEIDESKRLSAIGETGSRIVLLAGGNSPPYGEQNMNIMAEVIPGAKKVVVPGVGHEAFCGPEMRGQPKKMVPIVRECFQ